MWDAPLQFFRNTARECRKAVMKWRDFMLEEHFEREYPISLEDTSTGFILKGDSGSEFYFNKIQSEDEIEKILSGCEVDFSYCSD